MEGKYSYLKPKKMLNSKLSTLTLRNLVITINIKIQTANLPKLDPLLIFKKQQRYAQIL